MTISSGPCFMLSFNSLQHACSPTPQNSTSDKTPWHPEMSYWKPSITHDTASHAHSALHHVSICATSNTAARVRLQTQAAARYCTVALRSWTGHTANWPQKDTKETLACLKKCSCFTTGALGDLHGHPWSASLALRARASANRVCAILEQQPVAREWQRPQQQ